ncbi:MAG: hypothetical protein DLM67_13810 [Candidatus Nephthysia bennettiae]|nr:MAG: hypothetical protein DLM67_13810 [Candidatus Dormibacteraeota bacterium]
MVSRGVTERELADLAGISIQTLYSCLAGKPIAARTEAKIVRALNDRKPLAVAADLLEVG